MQMIECEWIFEYIQLADFRTKLHTSTLTGLLGGINWFGKEKIARQIADVCLFTQVYPLHLVLRIHARFSSILGISFSESLKSRWDENLKWWKATMGWAPRELNPQSCVDFTSFQAISHFTSTLRWGKSSLPCQIIIWAPKRKEQKKFFFPTKFEFAGPYPTRLSMSQYFLSPALFRRPSSSLRSKGFENCAYNEPSGVFC